MPKPRPTPSNLLSLTAVLLLTACQSLPVQPVEPARAPPLPVQARPSLVKTPSICSLTCSTGIAASLSRSESTLTGSASPALPASGPTRR